MDFVEAFQRLGASLAIGLLVGCERGWQDRDLPSGSRTAGIRTFGLAGVLGGLAGYIQLRSGPIVPAVLLLLFGTAIIGFKLREAEKDEDYGVTTTIASFVVVGLGNAAVIGDLRIAAAGAVAVTAILAAKRSLHGFLQRLSWLELRAALILLAMTLIALPLLPNRTVDRWNVLNPFAMWLMTITIPAVSFAGYVAIRLAGPHRGVLFAGGAGGLVSSTALTLSFARFAKDAPRSAQELASGALLAGGLSLIRVVVIGGALSPGLFYPLALSLTPAVLVLFFFCAVIFYRSGGKGTARGIEMTNPFELREVLRFGILLSAITLVSKIAVESSGQSTIFAVAAASGLVDLDAITVATARLSGKSVEAAIATAAILTAVTVNLLTKLVLAFAAGGRGAYARILAVATMAAIAAGAVGYLAQGVIDTSPVS